MPVIRELIAKLGWQVDQAGFQRAEAMTNRLRGGMQAVDQRLAGARTRFLGVGRAASGAASGLNAMGTGARSMLGGFAAAAGAAGIGRFVQESVELASNARETQNVLGEVFGTEGSARIQSWASTVSKEVGRSQFTLREFAGQLGAMAAPMTGSVELAEEMSTSFAQLAVDLSSFFNTTETDALQALKSGLSGESEPLRRFGVVLLDATLQEFALAQGIHKRVQQMTVAEKTELRYRFIMSKTTSAQGDAARTGGDYANSVRALKDGIKDLQTEMGLRLMPAVRRVVTFFRQGIDSFREMQKHTRILETALGALAAIAVAVGLQFLAPFILPAAAVVALILLVEDLHALFTGGSSVIGHYLDVLFGIGTADGMVRNVNAGLEIMVEWWGAATTAIGEFIGLLPDLAGMWEIFTGALSDAERTSDIFFGRMIDGLAGMVNTALGLLQPLADALQRVTGIKISLPKMDTNREATARSVLASRQAERFDRVRAESDGRAEAEALRRSGTRTADGREVAFGRASVSAAPGTVSAPGAAAGAGGNVTVQGGPVSVVVGSGNAREVERVVARALERDRRKTVAAIQRQGG